MLRKADPARRPQLIHVRACRHVVTCALRGDVTDDRLKIAQPAGASRRDVAELLFVIGERCVLYLPCSKLTGSHWSVVTGQSVCRMEPKRKQETRAVAGKPREAV